jgi:hypothetical protein
MGKIYPRPASRSVSCEAGPHLVPGPCLSDAGLAGPCGFPLGTAAKRVGHGEDLPPTCAPQRELRGGTPLGPGPVPVRCWTSWALPLNKWLRFRASPGRACDELQQNPLQRELWFEGPRCAIARARADPLHTGGKEVACYLPTPVVPDWQLSCTDHTGYTTVDVRHTSHRCIRWCCLVSTE